MRDLIQDFTSEGDLIVDFCMRHGMTTVAAKLEGRKFIGVEKEEEATIAQFLATLSYSQ